MSSSSSPRSEHHHHHPPHPPSSIILSEEEEEEENVQEEQADEEEGTLDYFLESDHALMIPLQEALLERMNKKLDKLSIILRDKEEEGRRLARHREDIGTQLYAYQQQLGSLQNNIELANEDRQWIDDKVREVKERVEGLTKEHDICNKEVRDQMDMLERVREERNEVSHSVEQLKRYKEGLEGNILLKKREAYKGEANIQAVEKDKAKQDILIDELSRVLRNKAEHIALLEAQMEVQSKEGDNANMMIREATQALEEINDERKIIRQEVNSNYVGITKRDVTMHKIMEKTNNITADILNMDNGERTVGKSIRKRRELHEQLEGHVKRNIYDISELKRLIESGGRGKEALVEEYELLSKSLNTINNDTDMLEGIRKKQRKEYDDMGRDIELFERNIKGVEEAILDYIAQETTINRNTLNTIKETKDMQEGNMDKERDIADSNNQVARAQVDVLNIKAHNNVLSDRIEELDRQFTEAEDVCRRYDDEVMVRMRLIDKKQLMLERLNKEYDEKRSSMADMVAEEAEVLGPLEAKIRGIRLEIEECRRKCKSMQRKWIMSQSDLMGINDEERQIREKDDVLLTKIIILEEKMRRLELVMKEKVNDKVVCDREIRRLREDLKRINKRIGEYRDKVDSVNRDMKDVQGRVLDSLSKKEEDIGVVYKAVDGSKDTGLKLEEDLIECERQMTQWEKKLTLEEELQQGLDPSVGQSTIGIMKKEMHRMELRYNQLLRKQEELVREMTRAVEKRDIIEFKFKGDDGDQRANRIKKDMNINRNLTGLQRKLAAITEATSLADVDIKEKEGRIMNTGEDIRDLATVLDNNDGEIEQVLAKVCGNVVRKGRQFAEVVGIQHETRRLEKRANNGRISQHSSGREEEDGVERRFSTQGRGQQQQQLESLNDSVHSILLEAADK